MPPPWSARTTTPPIPTRCRMRRSRSAVPTPSSRRSARAARSLKTEVDDEAAAAARSLNDAGGILDDYAGNAFSNFFGDAGEWLADTGAWLMDNVVPILEDILRAALPIVAILSLFFPALGAVALVMSGILVAIDGLQALTGRGDWTDFAVGALGMLAGGALGMAAKSLIGPGGQVLIPSIQRMTPGARRRRGGSRIARRRAQRQHAEHGLEHLLDDVAGQGRA